MFFVSSYCSMSFIQVDQEFVVETNTTVNSIGEDITGEAGINTVPLSNNNKRSTFVDTEDNSAVEDYFPPLKRL